MFVVLALVGLQGASGAEYATPLEYKVKGGYLFNFARFVQWPVSTLPKSNSPFVIGVIDNGDVLPVVQSLLEGKMVDGHPVQIKAVNVDHVEGNFHMLFVTRTADVTPERIRTVLGAAATLLVGETERFAERGGMMGFTRDGENIRFTLNLDQTTAAGLKVSSKLSSVAKLVKTNRSP